MTLRFKRLTKMSATAIKTKREATLDATSKVLSVLLSNSTTKVDTTNKGVVGTSIYELCPHLKP